MMDMLLGRVLANKIRLKFSFLKPPITKVIDLYNMYCAKFSHATDNAEVFNTIMLVLSPVAILAWVIAPIHIVSSLITATILYVTYRIITFK